MAVSTPTIAARPSLPGRAALWRLALAGALVVALLVLLPGTGEVRELLAGASPAWLALALVFELGSCLAFVVAFRAVMAPHLHWRSATRIGLAMQGANVLVPAGGASGLAVSAWALRRGGMDTERISRRSVSLFVATSAVNFVAALAAGLALAAGAAQADIPLAATLGPAFAALGAIAAVALLPVLARRLGGDAGSGRGRLGRFVAQARSSVVGGVGDVGGFVRARRVDVAAGAAGYMVFDLLALAAVFAAVGAPPPAAALVLGYAVGQLGGLIPAPGGVGGTDGALVGALVLYGAPIGLAAAAVIGYRALQLGLPAILGSAAAAGLPRTVAGMARV
ncbi:MAG: flippase-like domain-containing protein [Solirubrobacteraceae bacterium]|nr:flippase-like domain-containing protein [Solirubrobacteraceae bacterium]